MKPDIILSLAVDALDRAQREAARTTPVSSPPPAPPPRFASWHVPTRG